MISARFGLDFDPIPWTVQLRRLSQCPSLKLVRADLAHPKGGT